MVIQGKIQSSDLFFPVKLPLPARFRPAKRLTEDELLAFNSANGNVQWEMESDGTIVMMTPAGGMGNKRENYVARELEVWSETDDRGVSFGYNAGFYLPDGALLSPDAAWVPKERWLALTPAQREKYLHFCPSFAIEVLSASDSLSDTEVKMEKWMANGTELGWLIDPFAALVTVYRAAHATVRVNRPGVMRGESCVAGFELPMERLWA